MTILDEIYSTYVRVRDCLFGYKLAKLSGSQVPLERMSEIYVNDEYDQIVGQYDEVAFTHRVNMLPNRSEEEKEEILIYWGVRCDIAHGYADGGRLTGEIEIPVIYQRIKAIMM